MSSSSFISNISLLRTSFIPDRQEAAQIRDAIASQEATLAELDSKILALQAQRQFVSESLDVNKAFFSPVRRLAPEILGEIFGYFFPLREDLRWPTPPNSPLLLLHVCGRWSDVIHGSPRLWTNVSIYCQEDIPFASMCLRNSRSLPLDVTINIMHATSFLDEFLKFTNMLSTRIPSSRVLSFTGPLKVLMKMDHLEEFTVTDICYGDEGLLSFLEATYLHTLALYDAPHLIKSIKPTTSLRRLTIIHSKASPARPMFKFLRSCPGIEELAFHCYPSLSNPDADKDPIILPALWKLDILTTDCALELTGLLHTPCLRSLSLSNSKSAHSSWNWQTLRPFLSGVRPTLCHLSLHDLDISSDRLHQAMGTLTELQTLELTQCRHSELWRYLTLDEGTAPALWICPKLVHLNLSRITLGEAFVEFARSRAEPLAQGVRKHNSPGYLVDIKLDSCRIHHPRTRKDLWSIQSQRKGLSIEIHGEKEYWGGAWGGINDGVEWESHTGWWGTDVGTRWRALADSDSD